MVYKHAISTVVPSRQVNWHEGAENGNGHSDNWVYLTLCEFLSGRFKRPFLLPEFNLYS